MTTVLVLIITGLIATVLYSLLLAAAETSAKEDRDRQAYERRKRSKKQEA